MQPTRWPKRSGFTLLELLITVAIAAALLGLGIPSFQGLIERARLKALTETVYSELQFAKAEALKGLQSRAGDVRVTFKRDVMPQCFGMTRGDDNCDCSNDCTLDGAPRLIAMDERFPGVELAGSGNTTIKFDSIRGTATANSVVVKSTGSDNKQLKVIVSTLGRIRICVPSGKEAIAGYERC